MVENSEMCSMKVSPWAQKMAIMIHLDHKLGPNLDLRLRMVESLAYYLDLTNDLVLMRAGSWVLD